jgi:GNAT superfamily N-acetyltransferase
VTAQLERWLETVAPDNPCGRREWISADEGEIYVRYNAVLQRFDLSNISIDPEFQRRGIMKQVIEAVCATRVKTVRVENILNLKWAEKVQQYEFDGRQTTAWQELPEAVIVDFVRS